MDWYGNGMDNGDWIAMIAAITIFWGLVILAGLMIFRGSGDGRTSGSGTQDPGPLEIPDERFARGEVGREEYEAQGRAPWERALTANHLNR